MRRTVAIWSILLTATALSGCLSDEPQSLTLPSVRVGDEAEYGDRASQYHLTIGSSTLMLTGDLVVVDTVPLEVNDLGRANEEPPHEVLYHAGSGPAVGMSYSAGGKVIYHPLGNKPQPNDSLALLPFHGFAGKTLRLGSSVSIPPVWFGSEAGEDPCLLKVDRLYIDEGETRAEATCQVSDRDVRFVFTEGSAYPLRVEMPRHELDLKRHSSSDGPEVALRDLAATELAVGPYGEDGPIDGEEMEYSLAEATAAVRQGLETREARKCLEGRPDAVLTDADLLVYSNGHEWDLVWSASDGVCKAHVDSRDSFDDSGLQDETESNSGEGTSAPSEALVLAHAFTLWDRVMDEDLKYFRLELDTNGTLKYDMRGQAEILVLDAGTLRLEHILFQDSP